jgi:Zn-dependent protease
MLSLIYKLIINILPLFFAIVLHEIAHGVAAYCLGDDTAKKAGRFKLHTHFDLLGSFLIPLGLYLLKSPFLIGFAKPVPLDAKKFKDPLQDMALVAIAGPLCNFILAFLTSLLLRNVANDLQNSTLLNLLLNFLIINLALFFFNIIPIPPLDGSRVLAALLPSAMVKKFYALEPFGIFIVFTLEVISLQVSNITGYNVGLFENFVKIPLLSMMDFLLYTRS